MSTQLMNLMKNIRKTEILMKEKPFSILWVTHLVSKFLDKNTRFYE